MSRIRIPRLLVDTVAEDEQHGRARRRWLAALSDVVDTVTSDWGLELGDPYEPGGQCAWIAPVNRPDGLVLKVGWRHYEAEHEADALRVWDGNGAVRCVAERDPVGLSQRMAGLLDLEPERVRLWLFARCTQESLWDPALRASARRLRP